MGALSCVGMSGASQCTDCLAGKYSPTAGTLACTALFAEEYARWARSRMHVAQDQRCCLATRLCFCLDEMDGFSLSAPLRGLLPVHVWGLHGWKVLLDSRCTGVLMWFVPCSEGVCTTSSQAYAAGPCFSFLTFGCMFSFWGLAGAFLLLGALLLRSPQAPRSARIASRESTLRQQVRPRRLHLVCIVLGRSMRDGLGSLTHAR